MIEIKGRYAAAKIFTETLENSAIGQLQALCDCPVSEGATIRIMPDAHAGAGCVIGTTMTLSGKVVPNMVGVDIGCGMLSVNLGEIRPDFHQLDKTIRASVPAGMNIRTNPHRFADETRLDELTAFKALDPDKSVRAIGTLGGGNHFIELAKSGSSGDNWLIIHSGSRNPGLQVAQRHQKLAAENVSGEIPFNLAWLEGQLFDDYIHDMRIMQEYASINRRAIADTIMKALKWKEKDSFETIHNYVDMDAMLVRKGAISSRKGERILIPMNMRDGSLLCEGLGNPEWNYSAPHGAGRLYSRKEAQEKLTLTRFKEEMAGIFSTSVTRNTIDESPSAYKPMSEILQNLGETARLLEVLKPVYNFKASK